MRVAEPNIADAMADLRNTAKDTNLIYDVGLHHGQDTDFYLKRGYRVVAFAETGRRFIAQLEWVVMRSIPGWYDTYAVHASVRKDR